MSLNIGFMTLSSLTQSRPERLNVPDECTRSKSRNAQMRPARAVYGTLYFRFATAKNSQDLGKPRIQGETFWRLPLMAVFSAEIDRLQLVLRFFKNSEFFRRYCCWKCRTMIQKMIFIVDFSTLITIRTALSRIWTWKGCKRWVWHRSRYKLWLAFGSTHTHTNICTHTQKHTSALTYIHLKTRTNTKAWCLSLYISLSLSPPSPPLYLYISH